MPAVVYMPPYVIADNEDDLSPEEAQELFSDEEFVAKPLHPIFIVLFWGSCVTFVLGFLGNSLLILMYVHLHAVRSATNAYIFSIAVTDLLLSLSCALMRIVNFLAGTWPLGETSCKISQATMEFATFATVLTLTVMSVERYYAIVHPLKRHVLTDRRSAAAIVTIWIIASLFVIPKFMNSGLKVFKEDGLRGHRLVTYCVIHQDQTPAIRFMSFFDFLVFYTIPFGVVCSMYVPMSQRLLQPGVLGATGCLSPAEMRRSKQRKQVARLVLVLCAIFFVGFLPHNVLILRILFIAGSEAYWNTAASYAYCYGCLHFWMSPIALYLFCKTIRRSFNCYLFWFFSLVVGGQSTSQESQGQTVTLRSTLPPSEF